MIENGTLTAERYVTEILNDYLGPFLVDMGVNAVFMQDNARPHSAQTVFAYFQEVGIRHIEWPARSSKLNPIEHACDEL